MKVRIRDVSSSGTEYQDQATPKDLDIADEFQCPVRVKGVLTRIDDYILATLDVFFSRDICCSRCLENIHSDHMAHYELEFEFGPLDEYVDIGRAIREEILIDHQSHALCRKDCKGICAGCGAELNKEECKCEKDKL